MKYIICENCKLHHKKGMNELDLCGTCQAKLIRAYHENMENNNVRMPICLNCSKPIDGRMIHLCDDCLDDFMGKKK